MFSFISNLFKKRPNPKQLATLEAVARLAVVAVEKPGLTGATKKAHALDIVGSLAKQIGLPVPDLLIDVAIEAAVRATGGGKSAR